MSLRSGLSALALGPALVLLCSSAAQAQIEDTIPTENSFESSEHFAFELRIGPYIPDFQNAALNDAFDTFYPGDDGLMWELELDVVAFSVPDVVDLGIGGLVGRANYSGKTLELAALQAGNAVQTDEKSTFRIIPMALMATARIDALPRLLNVPFIFTGKLGYEWAHYSAEAGTSNEKTGIAHGLRWAAQVALDLDTFEPSQARMMDEEWGINHSFVFFEYYGFMPSSGLEIGAKTWCAGLGFMF